MSDRQAFAAIVSVLQTGIPLALVVDGANRHGCKLLCATLDGIVIARPPSSREHPQHNTCVWMLAMIPH